ncbi:peroxisome proliferator-activated receptor gamma coactivator-related protein [Anaeramoeba flamelloides]|uniref:Peroxisome proliferator-activated receptor gamma coactivator-related protein n=1 Tax=Anaeramoeba flamelloides TaxID=1746091 RepID=A0AAV7YT35_9EUKA|nr:peroxisome proliferator-activated receptor gamma coactivator-related protein [Anaeramoeba flamelloides]
MSKSKKRKSKPKSNTRAKKTKKVFQVALMEEDYINMNIIVELKKRTLVVKYLNAEMGDLNVEEEVNEKSVEFMEVYEYSIFSRIHKKMEEKNTLQLNLCSSDLIDTKLKKTEKSKKQKISQSTTSSPSLTNLNKQKTQLKKGGESRNKKKKQEKKSRIISLLFLNSYQMKRFERTFSKIKNKNLMESYKFKFPELPVPPFYELKKVIEFEQENSTRVLFHGKTTSKSMHVGVKEMSLAFCNSFITFFSTAGVSIHRVKKSTKLQRDQIKKTLDLRFSDGARYSFFFPDVFEMDLIKKLVSSIVNSKNNESDYDQQLRYYPIMVTKNLKTFNDSDFQLSSLQVFGYQMKLFWNSKFIDYSIKENTRIKLSKTNHLLLQLTLDNKKKNRYLARFYSENTKIQFLKAFFNVKRANFPETQIKPQFEQIMNYKFESKKKNKNEEEDELYKN